MISVEELNARCREKDETEFTWPRYSDDETYDAVPHKRMWGIFFSEDSFNGDFSRSSYVDWFDDEEEAKKAFGELPTLSFGKYQIVDNLEL